jgi:hypothetical protein
MRIKAEALLMMGMKIQEWVWRAEGMAQVVE